MVDRRALPVEIAALRVGADQAVEVADLELVRVVGQRLEVADAVVARAGPEDVAEGQGAERGVAAGAAAGDREPVGVDLARGDQVARAVDAVVDVDDAPAPFSRSR